MLYVRMHKYINIQNGTIYDDIFGHTHTNAYVSSTVQSASKSHQNILSVNVHTKSTFD